MPRAAPSRRARAARRHRPGGVILAVPDLDGPLRAKMHRRAAEFFDEHGEHRQADRERELADREARDPETGPREPVAAVKSHHLIRSHPYRHPDPFRSVRDLGRTPVPLFM